MINLVYISPFYYFIYDIFSAFQMIEVLTGLLEQADKLNKGKK